MEKFITISPDGTFIGTREEVEGYYDDNLILNVDEAFTLSEKLIKFVADSRESIKLYPPGVSKKFYIDAVLDDIKVNLTK